MTIKEIEALPKGSFLTFNYKDENLAIMRKKGFEYKSVSQEYELEYHGIWVRAQKLLYGPNPQLSLTKYYVIEVGVGSAKSYSVNPNVFSKNKSKMVKILFSTGKIDIK